MKSLRAKVNHLPLLTLAKGGAFARGLAASRTENGHHPTKHLLQDRIVYSVLTFRARKGLGASIREISRTTGLHHKTVGVALNNLADLVHEHEGKWVANEPPEDWFRSVTDHTVSHWSERYAYMWLYLPRSGARFMVDGQQRRFSLNHCAVYSCLLSLADKRIVRRYSVAGLSKLLDGMNMKTIKTVISDLVALELIQEPGKFVKLLPVTESHLALFAPPRKRTAEIQDDDQEFKRPKTNKYEMKGDGYDDHCRLCQTFMPQSYAERAIRAIRFLGWSLTDFQLHLEDRKHQSEENVTAGKCPIEDFGKFYVTPLEEKVAAIQKERKLAEAEQRRIEFLNSPEGKEALAKQQEIIAADPLHPRHILDVESILSRVRFDPDKLKNRQRADNLKRKIHSHCHSYVGTLGLSTQQSVDKTGDLAEKILSNALASINSYYQKEELAAPEQFFEAVDEAIKGIEPKMALLFVPESSV